MNAIFEDWEDEATLYYFGYLWAHASYDTKRYIHQVSVDTQERYILEGINKYIGENYNITTTVRNNGSRIDRLVITGLPSKILEMYGIDRKKKEDNHWPQIITTASAAQHFLRGYYDAKGCLSWSWRKNRYVPIVTLSSNKLFANDCARKIWHIHGWMPSVTHNAGNSYNLMITPKNKALVFLYWLYSRATVMNVDKVEKLKRFLELTKNDIQYI